MVSGVSASVGPRSKQLQLLQVYCLLAFMITLMMVFGLLYDNVQVSSVILQQPLNWIILLLCHSALQFLDKAAYQNDVAPTLSSIYQSPVSSGIYT